MFSTNLIILGVFSLISIISIIIQTGWKFTHKLVPKLPKNKRWSDIFISTGHLSVIIFIFYTVNIWYWTDSSENRSDIYKMSETINLLESKVSNASQYLSTSTNILSFNEAVDALPEEAEEYINVVKELRSFPGIGMFPNLIGLTSQCDTTIKKLVFNVSNQVNMTKSRQKGIEGSPIWPKLRYSLKNGLTYEAPFNDKREQIKQHLESVSESLLNIAEKFKQKEQKLRLKMMETTNKKNKEFVIVYAIPSMIVFIFTLLSIYTTTFNPKLQSSLFVRIFLNVLFYIVAIHVVIVFIYEFVANSNQCQLDPTLLDLSDFEVPSFNKSSRTFTKEDFLNCTAEKSHIFAAPNDEIFLPTTIYDDYTKAIPATLIPIGRGPMTNLMPSFSKIRGHRKAVNDLVPKIMPYMMSGPIYSFDNKLRWKFENASTLDGNTRYSDEFDVEGVKWKIGIKKTWTKGYTYLHGVLNCSIEENQKAWICSVDAECFLLKSQVLSDKTVIGETMYCTQQNNEIGKAVTSVDFSNIIYHSCGYIENGAITVQFNFNFIFQNFSKNIENHTDVKLKVDGNDVYYKKELLCSQSKYFHDLFNEESNKAITEVTIDDNVKLEEFVLFLIAIQPKSFLPTSKLLECLKLADKFKAYTIVVNISQRLFSHFELIKKEQNKSIDSQLFIKCIQFAEKYNYDEIMFIATRCLKTSKEVKDVSNVDGFKSLKNRTKVMIFSKLLEFF